MFSLALQGRLSWHAGAQPTTAMQRCYKSAQHKLYQHNRPEQSQPGDLERALEDAQRFRCYAQIHQAQMLQPAVIDRCVAFSADFPNGETKYLRNQVQVSPEVWGEALHEDFRRLFFQVNDRLCEVRRPLVMLNTCA